MTVDSKRIGQYLDQIAQETTDIEQILHRNDTDILAEPHLLKSLKYSIIIIAEAVANTLQHILAKLHNTVVDGYMDVFTKSERFGIIEQQQLSRLQPFIRFRNMLVHQYWRVDDAIFLANIRQGVDDFHQFVKLVKTNYLGT